MNDASVPAFVGRHSVTMLLVHAVWATRLRAPLLRTVADAPLGALLGAKAAELGCRVLAAGNAADHVHVLVQLAPTSTLAELLRRLEGASSRLLPRQVHEQDPLAWQVGYWAESVGAPTVDAVARYVAGQRAHHDGGHAPEPWELSFP